MLIVKANTQDKLKERAMFTKNLLNACIILIALCLAIGCDDDKVVVPPESRTYSVKLNYSTGAPVPGATVNIRTPDRTFSDITGSDGRASVTIPNSVSLPANVITTIEQSSIMPEGRTFSGAVNTNSSRTITCVNAPSRILVREVRLHHTGDDHFGGSENSQLQIRSEGTSISFSFSLSSIPNGMPHIRFYARGVQRSTEIKINGITTDRFINSPVDGSLGRYSFQLTANPRTVFRTGSNVLTIKSGYQSDINDWDDIEFCALLLYYP